MKKYLLIIIVLISSNLFAGYLNKSQDKVGYKIDLDKVFERIEYLKKNTSDQVDVSVIGKYDGDPIYRIDIRGYGEKLRKKIIISAGVHGNESIGVNVLMELIEELIGDSKFRKEYDFIIFPALNPWGLRNNQRVLKNGENLNRTFVAGKKVKITIMIENSLNGEQIDLAMDLHEAVSTKKFFVVKASEHDNGLAHSVLSKISVEHLFRSTDHEYPYNLMSYKDKTKLVYQFLSPGEAISFSTGTLKSYFKEEFGALHSYTIESPREMDNTQKQIIYLKLVENFLTEFTD